MPTPILTNTMLGWAFQSNVLSNIKPKTSFLKDLYFGGRQQALPTESVELSYREGHTEMAPFVEVNAEALMVKGNSVRFANVSCPNIRIKRPMDAYNVFLRRLPGTGLFITGGEVVSAARQAAIAEDMQTMSDMIERREEWMVAQILSGPAGVPNASFIRITYSLGENANWTVSIPRPTGHVVTVSVGWDTSTNIPFDFHLAKTAMAKSDGLIPTDVILGATAAANFMKNTAAQNLLDKRNINLGAINLANQFDRSGVILLGNFAGVNVWQYAAQYTADTTLAATDYIGAEQAIFLHAGSGNEAQFFYGAIPDHGAFEQGSFVGTRFSKSWMENDPSVYIQLLQSRPLPVVRRPGSIYVLDTQP